jgi:dTDP-4-dehydrorhamnose 3,5-epimerase
MTVPTSRLVEERDGVRLVIMLHSKPGCGDVISHPQSPHLIEGIEIEPITTHPDERGLFAELFRFGHPGLARDFDPANGSRIQVSFTISYSGVIKAIHYHFEQTDLWAPLTGMFQVLLCDLREDSPTCGKLNTVFVGSQRPWKLRIPPGVGHGYRIVGPDSGMLVYATNRTYNPKDEGRIAFDDPGINYDWVTRPK